MQDSNDRLTIGLLGLFAGVIAVISLLVLALIAFVLLLTGMTSPAAAAEMTVQAVETEARVETEAQIAASMATWVAAITSTAEPIIVVQGDVVPQATATPDPDALNRLVIVTNEGGLITVDRDGRDLRALTPEDDRKRYSFPAWSPDSEHIAVIGLTRQGQQDGIYVFDDSAETDPVRIYAARQTPIYFSWTPDSDALGFIINNADDPSLLDFNIIPSNGLEKSRIVARGVPFYWDWTSTGEELLFNTRRADHADLAFLSSKLGDVGDEIAEPSPFFQSPDISADDAYIAYGGVSDESSRVVIEERASGRQTAVDHLGVAAFAWSPAANILAFVSPQQQILRPLGPLRLLELNGDTRTLVDDNVVAFFWSPDGTKIAYLVFSGGNGIGRDAAIRNGMRSAIANQQVVLKLDINVVDVATRERLLLGSVEPGELFVRELLPFYDQYAHSHAIWSPDSRSIALPIVDESGNNMVYRFDADGSGAMPIAPGVIGFWSRR